MDREADSTTDRLRGLLKKERESLGQSAAEVSRRCGWSRIEVGRLESGARTRPTIEIFETWAEALGLFVRVELSRTPGFSVENVELTPDQVAARAIFEKRLADLSDRDAQFLIEFLRRL
jgi:transcriptional regulator with XRE-family HTH domain